ncbi:uncharacterized protein V6R79_025299 [Siganus canaliculatus]
MNPPVIHSTNSVSTTRRKREAERSLNWTVEETRVLLCAWSDERVQMSLAENLRNRHVFKHLSARMSEMGFSRSPHQCRLRVKTLKANYMRAKLQRSINSSQPCAFKFFDDMDAVLGRRSVGAEGEQYFSSPERMTEQRRDSGCLPPDISSNTEIKGQHFGSLGAMGTQHLVSLAETEGRQSWQLSSEVKLEDDEDSTDEFEFSSSGFSQLPRDRRHEGSLESPVPRELSGKHIENGLGTPSPQVLRPPPFASTPCPNQTSTLSGPAEPNSNTLPTSDHHPHHHLESTFLEPALKHLTACFQQLVSESRGLLVQLESQRQEQARWHQELLAQWLQKEERRQAEMAEREERREKARMEHEIRVLELLTNLAREQGCKCGGRQTMTEPPRGPDPAMNRGKD